jgi:hypothetical protein
MSDQATVKKLTSLDEVRAHFTDWATKQWGRQLTPSFAIDICPEIYRTEIRELCLTEGAVTGFWAIREGLRFVDKTYQTMRNFTPTTQADKDLLVYLTTKFPLHFVHISKDQPGYIAYTPDATYGKQDRRLKTTPGRYLRKFFPELTDIQLQRLTDAFRYRFGVEDINWATTCSEKQRVYIEGPHSCMAYNPGNEKDWNARFGSHVHPVEAYDVPWIKIAYLVRDGKINSRCLVYENPTDSNDKRWIRSYGDEILRLKLEANGYKHGSLNGALLKRIPAMMKDGHLLPSTWVVPYIDDQHGSGNQYILDDSESDKFLQVVSPTFKAPKDSSKYGAANSNGLAGLNANYYRHVDTRQFEIRRPDGTKYFNRTYKCCRCGCTSSEEWTTVHGGGDVCLSCRNTEYAYAYISSGGDIAWLPKSKCRYSSIDNLWWKDDSVLFTAAKLKVLDPVIYADSAAAYGAETLFTVDAVADGLGRFIRRTDARRDDFGRNWLASTCHPTCLVGRISAHAIGADDMYDMYSVDLDEQCLIANRSGGQGLSSAFAMVVSSKKPAKRIEALRAMLKAEYAEAFEHVICKWFREYEARSTYAKQPAHEDLFDKAA